MAIYHASMKVFVRSKGQTATGAAAYRAGLCMADERTGLTHDYTRRGGVVRVEMFTTQGAPAWASDPAVLWNAAEKAEVRKDARVARELEVSLPAELSDEQRTALASSLASLLVERYGTAVLMAIHAPGKGDARNHHVHLLMPTRVLNANGLGAKIRVLDEPRTGPGEIRALREAVADITNRHLARAGLAERVDHRTLKAQADDAAARGDYASAVAFTRQPTVHLGRSITAMRRRNLLTSDTNVRIRASNQIMFSDFLRSARGASALRIGPASRVRTARPTGPGARSYRKLHPSGPGSRAIAAQARQVQRRQRQDERGARWFSAMLERTRIEITEKNRRILLTYAQAFGRTRADVEALAFHGQRDPGCCQVLVQALEARQAVEDAQGGVAAARDRRGQAMVRTVEARNKLERTEAEPAPSRFRLLSRREWAQKREAQRAALAAAQQAEREATASAGVRAAEERARLAQRALDEVEAQLRLIFAVPSDSGTETTRAPDFEYPPFKSSAPSRTEVRRLRFW